MGRGGGLWLVEGGVCWLGVVRIGRIGLIRLIGLIGNLSHREPRAMLSAEGSPHRLREIPVSRYFYHLGIRRFLIFCNFAVGNVSCNASAKAIEEAYKLLK